MAYDNGSWRSTKLWWVLAIFMLGAAAGALSVNFAGLYSTFWWIIGLCGSLLAVSLFFERLHERRQPGAGPTRNPWRKAVGLNFSTTSRKDAQKEKPVGRRGQLHAITGRKTADPPSRPS
jgi:hypothetical protein